MGRNVFLRARLKLAALYAFVVLVIFVGGFILNSWLDKILAESSVDPLLYVGEGLTIILVAILSFYFAGRTLRPIEDSYERQKKFVADAAHELRTPLAVMKTGTEAVLDARPSKADYQKLLTESLEEIDHMTTTVNDLLFMAQSENHSKVTLSQVNLTRLVSRQIEQMMPYAADKNIALRQDHQAKVHVSGNEAQLKRLLANVLKNALDYTNPNGKIVVSLRKDRHGAELTVSDTGIGIAEGDLLHIFDRFYKADHARTQQSGGAGLGLTIAQEIVKSHDAKIYIQSQPGKGTSVTITFPS